MNEMNDASEQQDTNKDVPTLQQSALVICSLFIQELQRANEKYPSYFSSPAEGLGVLEGNYQRMKSVLSKIKGRNGYALDEESFNLGADLKVELARLGAMCIKAAYSLCMLRAEYEAFSETLRQQAVVAGMMAGEEEETQS